MKARTKNEMENQIICWGHCYIQNYLEVKKQNLYKDKNLYKNLSIEPHATRKFVG